jgi:hypothetical protein
MTSHSRGAPNECNWEGLWRKCCDPKLGRGVTQLKCQRQWDALPVATSTGRVAKLMAMKAPNLEPRGKNPKTFTYWLPCRPSTGFRERYAPGVFLILPRFLRPPPTSCLVGFPPSPSDLPPLGRPAINDVVSPYNLHVWSQRVLTFPLPLYFPQFTFTRRPIIGPINSSSIWRSTLTITSYSTRSWICRS